MDVYELSCPFCDSHSEFNRHIPAARDDVVVDRMTSVGGAKGASGNTDACDVEILDAISETRHVGPDAVQHYVTDDVAVDDIENDTENATDNVTEINTENAWQDTVNTTVNITDAAVQEYIRSPTTLNGGKHLLANVVGLAWSRHTGNTRLRARTKVQSSGMTRGGTVGWWLV